MEKKDSLRAAYCPDCGSAAVSHAVERWSYRFDAAMGPLQKPFEMVLRGTKPWAAKLRFGRLVPQGARFAAVIGLGRIVDQPDLKNNLRATVLWEEARRRGIVMREFRPFGLSREIFFATQGDDTRMFDGLPRPRGAPGNAINWMDNKGIILKKFRAAGVPVPRGQACKTLQEAEKTFGEIVKNSDDAVIIKPTIGSRSRHTYMGIKNVATLRHAFSKAKELCPSVIVEEELPGFVFRITLIGGRVAGVMRREAPHVTGDGERTVRELIVEENDGPLRHGPIFHELPLGEETVEMLRRQALSLDSIPLKNQMVIVHPKVSRSYGASTTEMTGVHPDNEALFLLIAKVLDDPLVGVDFMMRDIGRSWKEQKCGVIECNSLPFIDLHHHPLKGPARNAAGALWDIIFPEGDDVVA